MKFSKKHIFFPIAVLIVGLTTMSTYPVNGSSDEERKIGMIVSPETAKHLSFSNANSFYAGEIVATKNRWHPGQYVYRAIAFYDKLDPSFSIESWKKREPVRANVFGVETGETYWLLSEERLPPEAIGKIIERES